MFKMRMTSCVLDAHPLHWHATLQSAPLKGVSHNNTLPQLPGYLQVQFQVNNTPLCTIPARPKVQTVILSAPGIWKSETEC